MRTLIAVVALSACSLTPLAAQEMVDVARKSGTLNPLRHTDVPFTTKTDQPGRIQSHQHEITVSYEPANQWVFGSLQVWQPNANPPRWWTMLRGYGIEGTLRASFGAPAYRSVRRWRFRLRHEDNIDGNNAAPVYYDLSIRRSRTTTNGGQWQETRRGEDVIDIPSHVRRIHLRVDPSGGTVSNFYFWMRDSRDAEWNRVTQGQVSQLDCRLGLACHFEGTYTRGNAVQLAMTYVGGLIEWTVQKRD